MLELVLRRATSGALRILCLGAHSDDVEIGCGGTILRLTELYPGASVDWVVLGVADDVRREEALAGADRFLAASAEKRVFIERFREAFFPFEGLAIKEYFEAMKARVAPDVIFTHYRDDRHQDHRFVSELTWSTFRSSLVLEYEIPKWDGDLGAPNCYVRIPEEIAERKIRMIGETFATQRARPWFTPDTFRGLMRLRGIESNAGWAEAFYARKLAIG